MIMPSSSTVHVQVYFLWIFPKTLPRPYCRSTHLYIPTLDCVAVSSFSVLSPALIAIADLDRERGTKPVRLAGKCPRRPEDAIDHPCGFEWVCHTHTHTHYVEHIIAQGVEGVCLSGIARKPPHAVGFRRLTKEGDTQREIERPSHCPFVGLVR